MARRSGAFEASTGASPVETARRRWRIRSVLRITAACWRAQGAVAQRAEVELDERLGALHRLDERERRLRRHRPRLVRHRHLGERRVAAQRGGELEEAGLGERVALERERRERAVRREEQRERRRVRRVELALVEQQHLQLVAARELAERLRLLRLRQREELRVAREVERDRLASPRSTRASWSRKFVAGFGAAELLGEPPSSTHEETRPRSAFTDGSSFSSPPEPSRSRRRQLVGRARRLAVRAQALLDRHARRRHERRRRRVGHNS